IPLARTPDRPEATAIHLGPSAVTDALVLLFALLWEGAHPTLLERNGKDEHLPQELEELLQLLSSGMSDRRIAEVSGVSDRTLRWRIANLHAHFGTSNRFQLGVVAGVFRR
uniref:LuxR C-terminal-related transcriptional regulator n=1 Tax=Enterobacter bugandensis TaxID=881260 RepID=UPI001C712269